MRRQWGECQHEVGVLITGKGQRNDEKTVGWMPAWGRGIDYWQGTEEWWGDSGVNVSMRSGYWLLARDRGMMRRQWGECQHGVGVLITSKGQRNDEETVGWMSAWGRGIDYWQGTEEWWGDSGVNVSMGSGYWLLARDRGMMRRQWGECQHEVGVLITSKGRRNDEETVGWMSAWGRGIDYWQGTEEWWGDSGVNVSMGSGYWLLARDRGMMRRQWGECQHEVGVLITSKGQRNDEETVGWMSAWGRGIDY